jgi:hypothetical protein
LSPPIAEWARAFLATQVIEVPIVVGWLRASVPVRDAVPLAILASTLTHPALWYLWPTFQPHWLHVGTGEALVWTVEAGVYALWLRRAGAPTPWRTGVFVSCLANASSMLTGFLIWPS